MMLENESANQPWWNDNDKAGGLAATLFLMGIAIAGVILVVGGAIKLVMMMLN